MARYTDGSHTNDARWESRARKLMSAAGNSIPWRHAEQEELLGCPHESDGYFDVIMRVRRRRPDEDRANLLGELAFRTGRCMSYLRATGRHYLALGRAAKVYKAGFDQPTVLIEFDSVAQRSLLHESPGYQAPLAALGNTAVVLDMRIVEGVDD